MFFSIDAYKLSYLSIDDVSAKEPLVFLHGIMGNKKNLAGFVTNLVKAVPNHSAIIIDLPNHGQSSKDWQPFTVEGCARAIAQLLEPIKPKIIVGHSFGGKVALLVSDLMASIEQLYMLDCPVGRVVEAKPLDHPQSFTAFTVMDVLEQISFPVSSRKELVTKLTEHGMPRALAMWMTTNLVENDKGLDLNFYPRDTRRMLEDFVNLDGWPILANIRERVTVHLVAAEHGQRVRNEEASFNQAVGTRGTFEILKDSGHFVHVDNPDGLITIFKKFLVS